MNPKNIFKSKIFLFGLILKFVCLFFFSSEYPKDYFIPFMDRAVTSLWMNPWSLSSPELFPYGGVLYSILLLPKYLLYMLFGNAALGTSPLSLFALKFPLLVFDYILLMTLIQLVPYRKRNLLTLYWLNPVLFYISYIYGQLDLVSISLFVLGLHYVLKNKVGISGLLIGLAIGCKFHIASTIPFFLAYFVSRNFYPDAVKKISKWLSPVLATSALAFIPVLLSRDIAYVTVASPEIERLFALQFRLSNGVALYLGVMLVLIVLGRLVISSRISDWGLVFGSGLMLSILVVSSHSAPGWYFWTIPFLCLFFTMYLSAPRILFYLLMIAFFSYYTIPAKILNKEFLDFPLESIMFTLLQTVLLSVLSYYWMIALKREIPFSQKASSFRIGIAGDSASGKSFLTKILSDLFHSKDTTIIEGDNYHKWERNNENWTKVTHLNPEANQLFSLEDHIRSITQGRPFFHAVYSHETGKFLRAIETRPSRTVIVQGLHTLLFKSTRKLFDLKIFLSPSPVIKLAWKIKRDSVERGHEVAQILEQLKKREVDAEKYIHPQGTYADLIIEAFADDAFTKEMAERGEGAILNYNWVMWNDVDLSSFSEDLNSLGLKSKLEVYPHAVDRIQLMVSGHISEKQVRQLALKYFSPLRYFSRGSQRPRWHSGYDGITQLVILFHMKKIGEMETA